MEAAIFHRQSASERSLLGLPEGQGPNGIYWETIIIPNPYKPKLMQMKNIVLPCEATKVMEFPITYWERKVFSETTESKSRLKSAGIDIEASLRRFWRLRSEIHGQRSALRFNHIAADVTDMGYAKLKRISVGKESCSLSSLVSAMEGEKCSSVAKQRAAINPGGVLHHQLRFTPSLPPVQNLSPGNHLSQNLFNPSVPPSSVINTPGSIQDDRSTQANSPPPVGSRPDIEQSGPFSREDESPPPPGEEDETNRANRSGEERYQGIFLLPLCGIAIFLAPVNIVSGMTASHGDNWKLAFVGFFVVWLVVGTTWLILDLRRLQRSSLTKRCLWHVAGCTAALYFFTSVLHITSDNLPQWLPTIIDCGVGTSLGFQNLPASARHRVGESINSIIGSIFGGTQVVVQREEQQPLQSVQSSASRGRRADIEMGPLA